MKRTPELLDHALRHGDTPAILDFFRGQTEEERQEYIEQVLTWRDLLERNRRMYFQRMAAAEPTEQIPAPNDHRLGPAAYAALLACGTYPQIKKAGPTHILPGQLRDIIIERRPRWTQAFAEDLCGSRFGWVGALWLRVRELVIAGACKAPDHDNYVLGGIEGVFESGPHPGSGRLGPDVQATLTPSSNDNPLVRHGDWFEGPFWRLFEIEGSTQISLAARDRFSRHGGGWCDFLVTHTGHRLLPRARLLDASLAALDRGFMQFRAGWFSRFHEALKPTLGERKERLDQYLRLLTSNVPPTVSFAADAVLCIDNKRPIPTDILLPALEPALRARTKKTAQTAVAFLERLVARDAGRRNAICLLATEALLSEHTEIQTAVLALLESHGDRHDERLRAKLVETTSALRPSLRSRFAPWLEPFPSTIRTESAPQPEHPARAFPTRARPTDPTRSLVPITSLDELFDRAAAVLESPLDIDDVERVLDGMARLGSQRPAGFDRMAMPLAKRAVDWIRRPRARSTYASTVETALAQLIVSWLGNKNYLDAKVRESGEHSAIEPVGFLLRRLSALADQVVAFRSLPLLSTPTHRGGWIEPEVLVERWCAWQAAGVEPDRHDKVLALLRLAPEGRDAACMRARRLEGEAGLALRYALGEHTPTGADAAIWLAAARSRQPHGDLPDFEKRHPRLGPGAGLEPRYLIALPQVTVEPNPPETSDPALLPVLLQRGGQRFGWTWFSRPLLRWTASLWPGNLDAFFFRAIAALDATVGWSQASDREYVGYLEPLVDPNTEMRPLACHTLALGIGAKVPLLRAQAQEGLIAALAQDRLPLQTFGTILAAHLKHDARVLPRWAKVFDETYRVSPQHAAGLARALPLALPPAGGPVPRDISAFLQVMLEILAAADARIECPKAKGYLTALTGSGRAPSLARQMLAR